MNKNTFQTIKKSVANKQNPYPVQPATGRHVSTTAFGSNASSTDIIRTDRKSA